MSRRHVTLIALACAGMLALPACGTSADFSTEPAPHQTDGPYSAPAELDPASPDSVDIAEPSMITTGSAHITTFDPVGASDEFVAAVTEAGGRVVSSESGERNGQPYADISARIPADAYAAVVSGLDEFGTVASQTTFTEDVGAERVDLEARTEALQASIDRLRGLMDEAGSVDDLLAAEETLTARQAELDSLQAQLAHLNDQVAMSTLDVSFTVTRSGGDNVFSEAGRAFVASSRGLVITFMGLLPWLLVLGLLAFVVVRIVRRVRAK